MIDRVLIAEGGHYDRRRAAYEDVVGCRTVDTWDGNVLLDARVLVDVYDPHEVPAAARDRMIASGASIVSGAPFPEGTCPSIVLACPDLTAGPVALMAGDVGQIGRRTMAKVVVIDSAPGFAVTMFRSVLALVMLGGPLDRLSARRQPDEASFDGIYAVGRFKDGAIAYMEAVTSCFPGADVRIYEVMGRDQIREYDSRRSTNRVIDDDGIRPLPATLSDSYAVFVKDLWQAEPFGRSGQHVDTIGHADAAYRSLTAALHAERAASV